MRYATAGSGKLRRLSRHILSWYRAAQRDLPWRHTTDPYRIWVSEVMLQQTTVAAVVPYYQRFIDAFPTLESLAGAELDEVLALWAGLGYYRRARSLHSAAREVSRNHAGRVPRDAKSFRTLPGVGEYTAGAVLSIAFDEPLAVVDGNVARVLARLFAVKADLRSTVGRRQLRDLANALLPPGCPGIFNQAMMELGALVCLPRQPNCEDCPMLGLCVAERYQLVEELPAPAPRIRPEQVSLAAVVVHRQREILLEKRPDGLLLGGLWGLPSAECEPRQAAARLSARLRERGLQLQVGPARCSIRHSITHHRISISVHEARVAPKTPAPASCRWAAPGELSSLALPALYTKALAALIEARERQEG